MGIMFCAEGQQNKVTPEELGIPKVRILQPNETPVIMAGEKISFTLKLTEEIPRPKNGGFFQFAFNASFTDESWARYSRTIQVSGETRKHIVHAGGLLSTDRSTVTMVGTLERDQAPGTYRLYQLEGQFSSLKDSKSYSMEHGDFSFEVVPDPNYVPQIPYVPPNSIGSGTLTVSLTRAQLLRSRARTIQKRLASLQGDLKSVPTTNIVLTRSTLLRAIHTELDDLKKTEQEELALESDPQQKQAAKGAFDDLIARYDDLIKKLQAAAVAGASTGKPQVILAGYSDQAKTTMFRLRDETTRAIETSAKALLLIAEDGNYIRSLSIQTLPQGATITYSTLTETHTWPKLSDIEIDSLHYGIWTITAKKDDLAGEVTYNPYDDTHHTVQIILSKQKLTK